jgi:hypothetical protein
LWCYFLLLFIRFLALLSGHLKNRLKKNNLTWQIKFLFRGRNPRKSCAGWGDCVGV